MKDVIARSATPIDETIRGLERLYGALTGAPPPAAWRAHSQPNTASEAYINATLDRLTSELAAARSPMRAAWIPAMCIWEGAHELVMWLEVPGVPREALRITPCERGLLVTGSRPAGRGGQPPRMTEAWRGGFSRLVELPRAVAPDRAEAQLVDGVLTIRVPRRSTPALSRRVRMKAPDAAETAPTKPAARHGTADASARAVGDPAERDKPSSAAKEEGASRPRTPTKPMGAGEASATSGAKEGGDEPARGGASARREASATCGASGGSKKSAASSARKS